MREKFLTGGVVIYIAVNAIGYCKSNFPECSQSQSVNLQEFDEIANIGTQSNYPSYLSQMNNFDRSFASLGTIVNM